MNKCKLEIDALKYVIIDAAIELFAKQGYSATNLKDIAKRAGVSRTPLYYHFENKYLLYEQAADVYLARMKQSFFEVFAEKTGFFEKLRNDLLLCTKMNLSEENFFAEAWTNPELKPVFEKRKQVFDEIYQLKQENIRRAVRQGELRADVNVEELVYHIYVLHYGFLGMDQCRYHKFAQKDMERLLENMVEELRNTFGAERSSHQSEQFIDK